MSKFRKLPRNFISSPDQLSLHHEELSVLQTKARTLCENVGRVALEQGVNEAQNRFMVTRGCARYWMAKMSDPTFHPGLCSSHSRSTFKYSAFPARHGGPRNWKFGYNLHAFAEAIVFMLVRSNPQETLTNYASMLRGLVDNLEVIHIISHTNFIDANRMKIFATY